MAKKTIHTVFMGSLLRGYFLASGPDEAVQIAENQDGTRSWWDRLILGAYTAQPGYWC